MGSFTATAIIYWQRNQWLLMRGGHSGRFLCMCDFFKEHSKTSPFWYMYCINVVQFLFTRKNVSWMPSIKCRLSIKLYKCLPKKLLESKHYLRYLIVGRHQ